ncbi:hypothetical protein BH09PSE1_BH09PSE1_27880 [soil metagenome]
MAIGTVKTPWHLWVVGVLSLLWNGFGAIDLTMTLAAREVWFKAMGMTSAQVAMFDALPGWMWVAWAFGVYGAIAGSILLLLRRKWAVQAFGLSILGALASLAYHSFLAGPGGPGPIFPAIIVVIAALLLWYAWAMGKRGVLR